MNRPECISDISHTPELLSMLLFELIFNDKNHTCNYIFVSQFTYNDKIYQLIARHLHKNKQGYCKQNGWDLKEDRFTVAVFLSTCSLPVYTCN